MPLAAPARGAAVHLLAEDAPGVDALAGKEAHGIYVLDGDTLRICYTMPGERRPTAFESAAGSKAFLVQWKRL